VLSNLDSAARSLLPSAAGTDTHETEDHPS